MRFRLLTLFWGLTRILVAVVSAKYLSDRSVVDQVLSVAGFTTGVILGLFLLGRVRRPVGAPAALGGLFAGFIAVSAVWFLTVWGRVIVAWPWYAPIGTIVTVTVTLLLNAVGFGHGSSADGSSKPGVHEPR